MQGVDMHHERQCALCFGLPSSAREPLRPVPVFGGDFREAKNHGAQMSQRIAHRVESPWQYAHGMSNALPRRLFPFTNLLRALSSASFVLTGFRLLRTGAALLGVPRYGLGMGTSLPGLALRLAWAVSCCFVGSSCSLIGMIAEEDHAAERRQQQAFEEQAEQQRLQAELRARQREMVERLGRLRDEIQAGHEIVGNALMFARTVVERQVQANAPATQEDTALLNEAVSYLLKAMEMKLVLEEHAALAALPRSVAVDNIIVSACPRFRPLVNGVNFEPFMAICIERAGNDPSRLAWFEAAQDYANYQSILARRQAEDERQRVAEARRAREAEKERRRTERAAAAAHGTRNGTCYSDSECGGGTCRNNQCTTAGGTCYSDSECPGGTCRSNRCTTAGGTCYSDSECAGGTCRSNQCTTAGGTCYSDSECPGGTCRSNRCTTAGGTCYSDSECGGGVCRNSRCTTAGGTCYSDSECPGGTCRNSRCS